MINPLKIILSHPKTTAAIVVGGLVVGFAFYQRNNISSTATSTATSVKDGITSTLGLDPEFDNPLKTVTHHDRSGDTALCEPFIGHDPYSCNPSRSPNSGSIDDECRESPNEFTGIYDIPVPPKRQTPSKPTTPYCPPTSKQPTQPRTGQQPYQPNPVVPDTNSVDSSYVAPVLVVPIKSALEGQAKQDSINAARLKKFMDDLPKCESPDCGPGGN